MHTDAESKLLAEGAVTYVAAVNAVLAFRDIIKRRCRRVVENRLPEYARALQWDLDADSLVDWETTLAEWSGDEATVGNYIKFGKVSALYHVVYLTADPATPPAVATTVYLGSGRKADRFWAALSPHAKLTRHDSGREIWLSETLSPDDVGRFEEKLDHVLANWIKVWTQAGGLARLWSPSSDGEE